MLCTVHEAGEGALAGLATKALPRLLALGEVVVEHVAAPLGPVLIELPWITAVA